jgi:hypothetical protein
MISLSWHGDFKGQPAELLAFARALLENWAGSDAGSLESIDWAQLQVGYGDRAIVDLQSRGLRCGFTFDIAPARAGTKVSMAFTMRFRGRLRVLDLVPKFVVSLGARDFRRELARLPSAFEDWKAGRPIPPIFEETQHPDVVAAGPADWMRWDPITISANRSGRIAEDQRPRVRRSLRGLAAVCLIAWPLGWAFVGFVFHAAPVPAISLSAAGFAFAEAMTLRYLALTWSDLRQGNCASVEGAAYVSRSNFGASVTARVGSVTWRNSGEAAGFVPGATYRVYYLPRSKYFINAEAAPQERPPRRNEEIELNWEVLTKDGVRRSGHWKGVPA